MSKRLKAEIYQAVTLIGDKAALVHAQRPWFAKTFCGRKAGAVSLGFGTEEKICPRCRGIVAALAAERAKTELQRIAHATIAVQSFVARFGTGDGVEGD